MLESLFHESVETPTQVLSCEISKHSKTIFFTEHLRWLLEISYEISYICFIFLKNTLFSYQTVHQSEIQWWKFLFVKYILSFIRTSKFFLMLAVLFFFFFIFETEMFLICSYFPDWTLQCHKEECQTEYNKNTLFYFFHSFSVKQLT